MNLVPETHEAILFLPCIDTEPDPVREDQPGREADVGRMARVTDQVGRCSERGRSAMHRLSLRLNFAGGVDFG